MDLRFSYANALARAGHLDRARDAFEMVANGEEADRFPSALYELGNIYTVRRQPLIAKVWFERYLRTMMRLKQGDDPLVEEARRKLAALGAEKK